jgi:hypothetical protein
VIITLALDAGQWLAPHSRPGEEPNVAIEWEPEPVWTIKRRVKYLVPTGIRTSDRSGRTEPLCRLSYIPASIGIRGGFKLWLFDHSCTRLVAKANVSERGGDSIFSVDTL